MVGGCTEKGGGRGYWEDVERERGGVGRRMHRERRGRGYWGDAGRE